MEKIICIAFTATLTAGAGLIGYRKGRGRKAEPTFSFPEVTLATE